MARASSATAQWQLLKSVPVYILALEMAGPVNQHCVNCIGTPSFAIVAIA